MNKLIVCLLTVLMSFSASAFAVASEHEQERVKEAGEVLKEIRIEAVKPERKE